MTKEEVRELAIAKLQIRRDDVIWDVGAGTGSVSVEAALAASAGRVYSIEKDDAALELLARNKERFGTSNLHIVSGTAPEALDGLPAPDRVFIGGSSGKLARIVEKALTANPHVRLCITAITLETLIEALSLIERFSLENADVVQVSVARARELAGYHMMRAHNPIYILCADGPKGE